MKAPYIIESRPEDSTEDGAALVEIAKNGVFVGVLAINASAEGQKKAFRAVFY